MSVESDNRFNALKLAIELIADRRFEFPGSRRNEELLLKDYEQIAIGTAERFIEWIITGKYDYTG